MRDLIQKLFDDNFDTIQEDLDSLERKDRLKFLADLLPFLVAKKTSEIENIGFPKITPFIIERKES